MLDYDVIQIGFGPVGQVNAALLGQHGHRVGVFERWSERYALPRAGHIDHEIMRILQSVGIAAELEKTAIPVPDYDWVNGDGDLLLHLDWDAPTPSGWKSDYLFYQPLLEESLVRAVERCPTVEVHRGWEATAIEQKDDHVQVTFRGGSRSGTDWVADGREHTVAARYVVGADGAQSFTRLSQGISWEDLGFEADWLVVDVRPDDPDVVIDMPDAGQICDPVRPVSLFRWLGRNHCRWEFMLLPGETHAEMTQPERVWELLSPWDVGPDRFSLVRKAVYTFRSMLAEDFRNGRVLLIGDAAHLMPPFMGQGMASGFRDAVNLAWKLDLTLRGIAPDTLLDTYVEERRPHVEAVIRISMALGQIVCVSDPQAAAERDEAMRTGKMPPPPPFPWLTGDLFQPGGAPDAVGHLGVQGRIVVDGVVGMADDLLGEGWTLITSDRHLVADLTDECQAVLRTLRASTTHVSRAAIDGSVIDIDATYSRWFRELDAVAVLIRPDFYVYGVARSREELNELITEVGDRLTRGRPALQRSHATSK